MANSLVAKRKPLRGTTNNHLSIINNHFAYPNRRNNPKTHRPPNKPPIQPNLSTNYDLIIQNKANFGKAQMNVSKVITEDYENKTLSRSGKNKANSKPIQTQNEPNFKGKKISRPANPATRRKDEQIISRKDEQAYRRKDEQVSRRKEKGEVRR